MLPDIIREVLGSLRATGPSGFSKLDDGRYELFDGKFFDDKLSAGKVYALLSRYDTKVLEAKNPEKHQKFIDIHYMIEGDECIGVAFDDPSNISSAYDAVKDVALFSAVKDDIKDEIIFKLREGNYAIFFPGDIHRPGIAVDDKSVPVRKCVVKVDISILDADGITLKPLGGG